MDERTWIVVKFTQDDTVEAVPSSWVSGSQCYWPPFTKQRLQHAIKIHETPCHGSWQLYDVYLFRNNIFDNLVTAQKKAKKATMTSDLESDSTLPVKRRRVIKKFTSFSSVSESEEDLSTQSLILPPPPQLRIVKRSKQDCENSSDVVEDCQQLEGALPMDSIVYVGEDNGQLQISEKECSQKSNYRTDTTVIIQDEGIGERHIQAPSDRELLVKVIHKQNLILGILKDINARTQNNWTARQQEEVEVDSFFTKFDFPLKNVENLDEFEEFISRESDFNKVKQELIQIGGSDLYNFIARSLEKIITNKLASSFSYYGKKGKNPFNKLKLNSLLIKASQISFTSTVDLDCEKAIGKWLRRAKERKDKK